MFEQFFKRKKQESQTEKALAIVNSAQDLPAMQGLSSVQDWLDSAVDKAAEKKEVLPLLLCLNDANCALLQKAERELLEASGNSTRTNLLSQAAQPFCMLLANAYGKNISREGPAMAERQANVGQIQLAIANMLFWTAKAHLLRFVAAPKNMAFAWDKIYQLHEFAEKIEAGGLSKLTGASSNLSQVQKQLAYLLLLARSLSTDLNSRQVLIADRIVQEMAGFIHFGSQHSAETPFATINQDGPPTQQKGSENKEHVIYFGLDNCIAELMVLEHLISSQHHLPAKLDFSDKITVVEALNVMRVLRLHWSGRALIRKDKRLHSKGELQLIYEFSPIRRMISLLDGSGQTNTIEPTRVKCVLDNISISGIGVLLKPNSTWAKASMLVGVKQAESSRWSLAVTRRIVGQESGGLLLGLQWFSTEPESVRLIEKSETSKWEQITEKDVYKNHLAILADSRDHKQTSLLLPGKHLVAGQTYYANTTHGPCLIRVTDLAEIGADFARYSCQVTPLPDNEPKPE